MKGSGTAVRHAGRYEVWKALNDPQVLVRTIPGCQRLETIAEDTYRMTITAGVASIKGVYIGQVGLTQQEPPDRFVLKAAGSGGPDTVSAEVVVSLAEEAGSTTTLTYDADAVVGGMIGGVGQRMLSGVAKKTAGEFFSAVDDVLTGKAPDQTSTGDEQPVDDSVGAATSSTTGVFDAPGAAAALAGASGSGSGSGVAGGDFVKGAVVGVAATVLGALVGGWLSRRRS
ncbi:MAG: SRPBCC domain-containing protein [Nocardioidaceae bacterium]